MHLFNEKNRMSSRDWSELLHRVRVRRFSRAAELLLKTRGEEPSNKAVKQIALKLQADWESLYQMRRESGYSTKEIAQEVLENVEDWLDSVS